MHRLTRGFTARIHKISMYMETQTKLETSNPLDMSAWVLKGGVCAYAIVLKYHDLDQIVKIVLSAWANLIMSQPMG